MGSQEDVLEDRDDGGFGIGVGSDEVGDGAEELMSLLGAVGSDAAPDLTIDTFWVGLHRHLGHDGELIPTAPKREEKLWFGGSVGVGDGSVCQNDLKVVDVVAREALTAIAISVGPTDEYD